MSEGYSGPRVSPSGVPVPTRSVSVPGEAFGVGLGVGIVRAGEKLADVALEQRREADGLAVTDAFGTYLQGSFDLLRNPDNGLLARELKGAAGITTEGQKGLDELEEKIAGGLTSDVQRQTFAKMAQSHRSSALNMIAGHETEQMARYRDLSASALIDAAVQSGQLAVQVAPQSVATEQLHRDNIDHIVSAVKLRLDGKLAPGEIARAQRAAVSDYWAGTPGTRSVGVIGAIPDGQEKIAEQLLKDHWDEINPVARETIQKRIDVANDRQLAQSTADKFWKTTKGDLGGALALAGEIPDAELRQETETRIRQRAQDVDASRRYAESQVFTAAEERFRAGGERVAAIPPSVWAKSTTEQRDYFRRAEKAKDSGSELEWSDVPDSVMQKWAAYKALPPEKKVEVPILTEFGHLIPNVGVRQLIDEQESYRNAIARGEERDTKYTDTVSAEEFLKTSAKTAELIPWTGKASEDQLKRYAAFEEAARVAIRDYETKHLKGERKATIDELRPLVEDLLIRGELQRPAWRPSPNRYLFEAVGDPTFAPDEIPAAERAQIEQALRSRGQSVTDAAVRALYLRAHGQRP